MVAADGCFNGLMVNEGTPNDLDDEESRTIEPRGDFTAISQ